MQLCLLNNDPTSTLLVTPEGESLFSIETPPLPHDITDVLVPRSPRKRSTKTSIKRLDRFNKSRGNVETEIGMVEYCGPETGTRLSLRGDNIELRIESHNPPLSSPQISDNKEGEQNEETPSDIDNENAWEFTGPDSKRYRWQLFLHSPVLLLADNSFTPLARYRRAKLGIVSRSRRAFLEILPPGINIIDFIVVTFVGFMKQRVLVDQVGSLPHEESNTSVTTRSSALSKAQLSNDK